MQHACLLLEHIGGSSGGELLLGQERAVAVEASEQEDRLCDLIDIQLTYISTIIERQ